MSRPLVRVAAVGVVAGLLAGLFGVGGGLVIVPALVLWCGVDQRRAHGTSLAAVLPIAVAGVAGFALDDSVDWPVAAALTAGAMVGAVIGTHVLHVVPVRVLGYAFAAIMVVSAVRLVVDDPASGGRGDLDVVMVVAAVVIGVLSGGLAGLLGVGGGVVMVPAMVIAFGIPAAVAKGTSLAVIVPTSVVGTARNVRRQNADMGAAATIGLAGVASAFAASRLAVGLDERVSNLLFAFLLVAVAVHMSARARRAPVEPLGSPIS